MNFVPSLPYKLFSVVLSVSKWVHSAREPKSSDLQLWGGTGCCVIRWQGQEATQPQFLFANEGRRGITWQVGLCSELLWPQQSRSLSKAPALYINVCFFFYSQTRCGSKPYYLSFLNMSKKNFWWLVEFLLIKCNGTGFRVLIWHLKVAE